MNNELRDFLKPTQPIQVNDEKPKKPVGRTITLADGKTVVELDDLRPEEKQSAVNSNIIKIRKKRHLAPLFETPDWLIPPKDPDEGLSEKQKEYKKNVFTKSDLSKTSPKVYKSKNRQGLSRFIFVSEVIACKNGFLYYTIPLLISLVILVVNLFYHNVLTNGAVALFALFDILTYRAVFKGNFNIVVKVLLATLVTVLTVVLVYLGSLIEGFYDGVYLPFTLKLLLIIFGVYHFGKFFVLFFATYNADCNLDFGNVVQINAGKPRSGKTSSGVHDVVALAKLKWKELCYDYKKYISNEDEIRARGNTEEILLLEEVKLSYEFYASHKCIPCLWSNIGIFDKQGRASHKITLEHIKGLKRLPLYSVVFFDEIGATLKADDGLNRTGHEKPLDVSDMFRLGGHFLKWVLIGTEQDFNHIFIDCRRVVGFNKVILGQEWICRPTLIYSLFNVIKWFIEDSLDKEIKKRPKFMKFMSKYEKFCKSIGFRRVKYMYANNTETGADILGASSDTSLQTLTKVKVRYMPSGLLGNYDDRAYKFLYPSALDKCITGEVHRTKHISLLDDNSFQFVNTTDALEEKRNVIIEASKDLLKNE